MCYIVRAAIKGSKDHVFSLLEMIQQIKNGSSLNFEIFGTKA